MDEPPPTLGKSPSTPVGCNGSLNINALSRALRSKLLDRESRFGKEYLKLLVNEIRINGDEAQISGSYAVLAGAIAEIKKDTVNFSAKMHHIS